MLRMAFNRHELARYRRQRKQGLLTQLAFIIAYHQLYEQREINRAKIELCQHASFMRAVVVQYGLV